MCRQKIDLDLEVKCGAARGRLLGASGTLSIHQLDNYTSPMPMALNDISTATMYPPTLLLRLLASFTSAQFQFFEQMFNGGGGHQHQGPQNMPSNSDWYQTQYEAGT